MVFDQGNEDHSQRSHRRHHARQPWFRKPSLTWVLCMKGLSSIASAVTAGPRVEIYTELVCREYTTTRVGGTPTFLTLLSGFHTTSAHTSISPESCASDPHIQRVIAQLGAVIAIIGGILSCLTTGWWGGFMDCHGRTRTMGIVILGSLLSDFVTFVVFFFSDILPGKYWFLVIASVMEGIMGVPISSMATETSYTCDVSESSNLARNFSLLLGFYYAGGTIGPVLGGFVNYRTGSVMAAFYAATVLHLGYALLAWFVMPESIPEAAIIQARNRYANELASVVDTDVGSFRRQVMILIKSFRDSFPLNVLTPKSKPNSRQRDWNMFWLAISAALINAITASGNSIYQYALYTFEWSSLDLGSFISASGLSTVIFLMVVLPVIINPWKRALAGTRHVEGKKQSTLFDLYLTRASCIVFAVGYGLMGISPTGFIFTLCFVITTFGHGFFAAVQSVATILNTSSSGKENSGRLFAALGVVYILGGRVIGPALYGTLYALTVSFIPSAILWLSVGCSMAALVVLGFVRLPDCAMDPQDTEQQGSDPTQDGSTELDHLLEPNGR